eukprot:g10495.t1
MILFSLVFHCVVLLLVAYTVNAKSAYEILNLTTTHFTDGELKQKYRALAKKYHPDKFRNKANMADINAKFLEITNAFEMLHNKPRNDDTVESLSLDLSIFFSGRTIKYTHHRKKKCTCPVCKGTGVPAGSPGPRACNFCGGRGSVTQNFVFPGGATITVNTTCSHCKGKGWQGAICLNCRGAGVIATDTAYNIVVNSGNIGFEARMFGEGNAEKNKRPGDYVFQMIPKDHPHFLLDQNNAKNLIHNVHVSLEQARGGFKLKIPSLSLKKNEHRYIDVPGEPTILPGQVRLIRLNDFTAIGGLTVNARVLTE